MRSLPLVVAVVCLFSGPARAWGEEPAATGSPVREGLLLDRGTLALGGEMVFQTSVASSGSAGFQFVLYPSVGYFVVDRLELEFALGMNVGFGDEYANMPVWFSSSLGARYHFELGSRVSLYAGLEVGLAGSEGGGAGWAIQSVSFSAPVGVLVGLNRRVALNLGLQPTLTVMPKTGNVFFHAEVGYLGVRAFF